MAEIEKVRAERLDGKFSKGMRKNISRKKAAARRAGENYTPPPQPEYLEPKQRFNFDRFMLPNLEDLPNFDEIIKPNISIVEDYFATRSRILEKPTDLIDELDRFGDRHPELFMQDPNDPSKVMPTELGKKLNPAFRFIDGRYAQVVNIENK